MDVYQMVTDRIIEQMNKGLIPWNKPWHTVSSETPLNELAVSYTTTRPYSALNQMLLGEAGEYLTFNQIMDAGGHIKAGAKARIIVFYKRIAIKPNPDILDIDGRVVPYLRYYNVFHIKDTVGVKSKLPVTNNEIIKIEGPETYEDAENVVNDYVNRSNGLTLTKKESNKAYFSPCSDEVVVPTICQYDTMNEYYSTLFHELTHSTGVKKRLNRGLEKFAGFGSEIYSREELVAEMGSSMILHHIGINTDKVFKNNIAYLQGWLKALKNDTRMIVWAASRAEKAARFILNDLEPATTE